MDTRTSEAATHPVPDQRGTSLYDTDEQLQTILPFLGFALAAQMKVRQTCAQRRGPVRHGRGP